MSESTPNTAPELPPGYIHVVAAVLATPDREVLVTRRPDHLHQGGLWEFPGGKVEAGEAPLEALARELQEELGISLIKVRPFISVPHSYPDRNILLDVYWVESFEGRAVGMEGQEIRWVPAARLRELRFPAADLPVLSALRFPSSYLITPEPGEPCHWEAFLANLHSSLASGATMVQLRAKRLSADQIIALATKAREVCSLFQVPLMINSEPELATRAGADGVHLTRERLMRAKGRPLSKEFIVGCSCHTKAELAHAASIDADFAVLSPVKRTTTHPKAVPIGWEGFQQLARSAPLPVYALGGLTSADLNMAWERGAQGIAGISGFWAGGAGE